MNTYKKISRKAGVAVGAVLIFKDWPTWLGFRIGLLKRDERERIFRIRDGAKFYFTGMSCSGAGYFQELYLQGGYFKNYQLKDGDTVIDIGAHIGIFSIMAAHATKDLRIVSYEPSPALCALLQRNIKLNGLEGNVRAFPVGIAEKEGKVKFWTEDSVNGVTTWESAMSEGHPDNYIMADVTTLEKIFASNNIEHCDFLKMDCEGAEFPTLLTAPSSLFKKISHMAIEYHMPPATIIERLNKEGFKTQLGDATNENVGMLYADRP